MYGPKVRLLRGDGDRKQLRPRAIIFDLDNCLAAANEVGEALLEPVFAAVRAANQGALPTNALDAAFHECWYHAFDFVAERYGFTPAMRAAGWKTFAKIEVRQPMSGYGDLDLLPALGDQRFLVTSGFRRLQESKIRALGIAPYFNEIIVDALDDPDRRGKELIFVDLMRRYALAPEDMLVVGDNPESELAAGRRLGAPCAQILRPGVVQAPDATMHVRDLAHLRKLLGAGASTRDW